MNLPVASVMSEFEDLLEAQCSGLWTVEAFSKNLSGCSWLLSNGWRNPK